MSKRKTHAAIIDVSKQALLKLLDFEGGNILNVKFATDKYFKPDTISIVIEHPDLTEVYPESLLTHVAPEYLVSKRGHYKRIDPPKKHRRKK